MSLEKILRGAKRFFAGGLVLAAGCGDTYNIINTPPTNSNQNTNYNSNTNQNDNSNNSNYNENENTNQNSNNNSNQNSNNNSNNNSNGNSNGNENTNDNSNDNENEENLPSLTLAKEINLGSHIMEVKVDEERKILYAATRNAVTAFSVVDEINPVQLGRYESSGEINVEGINSFDFYKDSSGRNVLVTAEEENGVRFVDMTDAQNPEILATIPTPSGVSTTNDVLIRERAPEPEITAIVASSKGIRCYKINDAENPLHFQNVLTDKGFFELERTTFGSVERIYAWESFSRNIQIYTVNSGALYPVGSFTSPEDLQGIDVTQGHFVYAFGTNSTREISVSDNPIVQRMSENVFWRDADSSFSASTRFANAFCTLDSVEVYKGEEKTAEFSGLSGSETLCWNGNAIYSGDSGGKLRILEYFPGD